MHRILTFFAFFVAAVLFQLFLFDNLSISIYLNPLVYVAFILLLPLDTPPIVLLGAGLAMGVVTDYTMGAAGINTIATLAVAFLRPMVLTMLCGRDNARDDGVPSPDRLGMRVFMNYIVILVLLHHTLFFLLEALSWAYILQTLLRIVVSSVVTVGFIYLTTHLLTTKLSGRL